MADAGPGSLLHSSDGKNWVPGQWNGNPALKLYSGVLKFESGLFQGLNIFSRDGLEWMQVGNLFGTEIKLTATRGSDLIGYDGVNPNFRAGPALRWSAQNGGKGLRLEGEWDRPLVLRTSSELYNWSPAMFLNPPADLPIDLSQKTGFFKVLP